MSYLLAIDVGTSFTAAAIARLDQSAPPVPESLPLGLRGTVVPSVVYYPEEGPVLVGEAAERRGLDFPHRVVREFKRRVGDAVPISVGTMFLPAEEVFATMARWVVDRAEEREGSPPSEIALSHPAAWGGHRTGAIREALAVKGLGSVTLITEPEAAVLHYASQVRVAEGSTLAVYDLGGGTFDTAVLKKTDSRHFELLGQPDGIAELGGADFDAAVFRHVAEHTHSAFESLDVNDPLALAAVSRLRRECVEAKEALSADSEASISVLLPGLQQQVRLVRSEFEDMIREPVQETVDTLEGSLRDLGLVPDDLSAVLLIGGSSRIPLVAQLISERLDRPIAVDADPKSAICLGAALAAVRARASAPSAVAAGAVAAGRAVAAAATAAAPGPAAARRASWSRNGTTTASSVRRVGKTGRGRAGAHAPKASTRVTAAAATAALFTVLTATAAQSPAGLGTLTSMFGPQQAGAAPIPGTPSAAPTASIEADPPEAAVDTGAWKPTRSTRGAGLDVVASPSGSPSAGSFAGPSAGSPGEAGGGAEVLAGAAVMAAGGGADPLSGGSGTAVSEPVPTDTATAAPTPTPDSATAPTTDPTATSTASPTASPTASGTADPGSSGTASPGASATTDPTTSATATTVPTDPASGPGTATPVPLDQPVTPSATMTEADPSPTPSAGLTAVPDVTESPTSAPAQDLSAQQDWPTPPDPVTAPQTTAATTLEPAA